MNNKLFVAAAIMCSCVFAGRSSAQTAGLGTPYLSAHLGTFITSRSGFSNTYNSNVGFAYGAGVGLPLTSNLYLCGEATYFTKSGTPWWYTYNYQNGVSTIVSKERNGSATFTQWIIDGGLQYNFAISKRYSLGVGAGLTYTTFSEKTQSANGLGSADVTGQGALGFYGGLSGERRFEGSPFAIFADIQYNYARQSVVAAVGNYGGTNLSLGLRYYFKQ